MTLRVLRKLTLVIQVMSYEERDSDSDELEYMTPPLDDDNNASEAGEFLAD